MFQEDYRTLGGREKMSNPKKTLDIKEKVCFPDKNIIPIPKDEIIKTLKILEGLKKTYLKMIKT